MIVDLVSLKANTLRSAISTGNDYMKTLCPSLTQRRLIFATAIVAIIAGCKGDSGNTDPTAVNEPNSVVNVDNDNVDDTQVNPIVDPPAQDNTDNSASGPTGQVRIQLNRITAEARVEEETFLNVNGVSNGTETSESIETFTIKGCSEDDVFFLSNDLRDNSTTIRGYLEVFAGTCIEFETPTPNPSPETNDLGEDNWFLFVTTQSNAAPETEQNALVDPHNSSDDIYSVTLPGTDQVTFVQDVRFGEVFAERLFLGENPDGSRMVDDRVTSSMTFTWSIGFEDCTFSGSRVATRCAELDGL